MKTIDAVIVNDVISPVSEFLTLLLKLFLMALSM